VDLATEEVPMAAWHSLALGTSLALIAGALAAQDLPKDIKRSVDTFTGDTIWETKYGRLDDTHGCKRSSLAIVWELSRGPTGRSEWLRVEYFDIETPFHSANFLGTVGAAINADGKIIQVQVHPLTGHLGSGTGTKNENASFLLPDSTLRLVANAQVPRLRILGTVRFCDGIIEPNMQVRLQQLLAAVN
jgi:hypothetical protein